MPLKSIETREDLLEALKLLSDGTRDTDPKEYRYILYARKSTDETNKQVQSLPDQLRECKEYADSNNLRIGKIFQEAVSAKEAGIRPKFREMITLLETKKYDGIIAWHPDRLARNMRDAGEIIDLVDKQTIKDLKFVSFNFDNSAGGKMHLGITFVLSKHYSDHLSESVNRGNRNRVAEGKYINKPKHGYIKNQKQYLIPDTYNNNFILIKNAFKMRLESRTLDEIASYLNENNYSVTRNTKKKGLLRIPYKMEKQRVSSFMKDPTYTGILQYGKSGVVNLTELYGFEPMLNVEEFMTINKLSGNKELIKLARSFKKGDTVKANLMRGMVMCSNCAEVMTPNTPTNRYGKKYFYYRCDNEDCERYGKSVRAKMIIDYIYRYLDTQPFSSPKSYAHYKDEIRRVSEQKLLDAKRNLRSLQTRKSLLEGKIEDIKGMLVSQEDEDVKNLYRNDLKPTQEELKGTKAKIDGVKTYIEAGKASILTYEEFLELMVNMPKIIKKTKNMNDLDYFIKKIFLNFTVAPKEVTKSTLNSPFDSLEVRKVSLGARERT